MIYNSRIGYKKCRVHASPISLFWGIDTYREIVYNLLMSKFSPWQERGVEVRVLGETGVMIVFNFKRIMVEYINALMEGNDEHSVQEGMKITSSDVAKWKLEYPKFDEYIRLRSRARVFANSMDSDFCYKILGEGALGTREISSGQVSAIKLIMQGKGIICANGTQVKKKNSIESFSTEKSDE